MNGHTVETQRGYQDETKYQFPNDAPEHERLERQAASMNALMNGRPFHTPLSKPKKILDIGCGTGYMTHLLALTYPSAHVIGIDIAPIPELQRAKLDNIEHVQADIFDVIGVDPRFELESFDYIFSRLLIMGVTRWPEYIANAAKLLKPGGWVEVQEPDLTLRTSRHELLPKLTSYYRCVKGDAAAVGLDFDIANHLLHLFSSTPALKDIRETQYCYNPSLTNEPPELFALRKQKPDVFALATERVGHGAGRQKEEVEALSQEIRSAFERGFEEGVYMSMNAVFGQKKATID